MSVTGINVNLVKLISHNKKHGGKIMFPSIQSVLQKFSAGTASAQLNSKSRIAFNLLGSYPLPSISGISLSGNMAYLADRYSGLKIIDVSNPADPTLLGSYDIPSGANHISISGTTAYAPAESLGLLIIDVGNPASPALLGSYDTPSSAYHVSISGTTAYVADGNSTQIIDVSNTTNPVLLSTWPAPGGDYVEYASVSGTKAYLTYTDPPGGLLQILNVTDPANPGLLGQIKLGDSASGISISGTRAYVAARYVGLQIIDVSNPINPVLIGSYDPIKEGIFSTVYDYAYNVNVVGTIAYVLDEQRGLEVIDVSDPAHTKLLGNHTVSGGYFADATILGTTAYVAVDGIGMQIIKMNNRFNPYLLGSLIVLAIGATAAGILFYKKYHKKHRELNTDNTLIKESAKELKIPSSSLPIATSLSAAGMFSTSQKPEVPVTSPQVVVAEASPVQLSLVA